MGAGHRDTSPADHILNNLREIPGDSEVVLSLASERFVCGDEHNRTGCGKEIAGNSCFRGSKSTFYWRNPFNL